MLENFQADVYRQLADRLHEGAGTDELFGHVRELRDVHQSARFRELGRPVLDLQLDFDRRTADAPGVGPPVSDVDVIVVGELLVVRVDHRGSGGADDHLVLRFGDEDDFSLNDDVPAAFRPFRPAQGNNGQAAVPRTFRITLDGDAGASALSAANTIDDGCFYQGMVVGDVRPPAHHEVFDGVVSLTEDIDSPVGVDGL